MLHLLLQSDNQYRENIEDLLTTIYPEYLYSEESIAYAIEQRYTLPCLKHYELVSFPHVGKDIYCITSCASTQDIARSLARSLSLSGYELYMTVEQEHGRGQGSHQWTSCKGNIFASILLPPSSFYLHSSATVFIGAVLNHFLRTLGIPSHNKWINDIFLEDKKVGGILLEQSGDELILGIGINTQINPAEQDILLKATSIASRFPFPYSSVSFMYAFREFLMLKTAEYVPCTPAYKDYIMSYLAYKGESVFFQSDMLYEGIIQGITDNGALLLFDGEKTIECSEGSLVIE